MASTCNAKRPKNYRTYVQALQNAPRRTRYNPKRRVVLRQRPGPGVNSQATDPLTSACISGEGSNTDTAPNETEDVDSFQDDVFEESCRGISTECCDAGLQEEMQQPDLVAGSGYSDLVQETGELQHLGLSIGSGCSEDELQEIGEMEQCGLAVGGGLSEDELQETEELSSFGCMDGLNVTPSMDMGPLLYESASLTKKESIVLIMAFANRHKLTGAATNDLLKLVSLHCPTPNHCCCSLYLLRKKFQLPPNQLQFHYYCPSCFVPLDDQELELCYNPFCKQPLPHNADNFFLTLSVENQLRSILSRKSV